MYNFDPYNILFAIATNIPVLLMTVEADIFSGIPRVTGIPRDSRGIGNKIATNHVIGTGEEKM